MTEKEYHSIAEKFFGIMLEKGIIRLETILEKSEIRDELIAYKGFSVNKKTWVKQLASVFREFEEREKASIKAEQEAIRAAKGLKELLREIV